MLRKGREVYAALGEGQRGMQKAIAAEIATGEDAWVEDAEEQARAAQEFYHEDDADPAPPAAQTSDGPGTGPTPPEASGPPKPKPELEPIFCAGCDEEIALGAVQVLVDGKTYHEEHVPVNTGPGPEEMPPSPPPPPPDQPPAAEGPDMDRRLSTEEQAQVKKILSKIRMASSTAAQAEIARLTGDQIQTVQDCCFKHYAALVKEHEPERYEALFQAEMF